MAYSEAVVFVETPIFTRRIGSYLDDDEYGRLQSFLADPPGSGKIIRNSGGMRKLRWTGSGRAKRGGLRLIYFWSVAGIEFPCSWFIPRASRTI